MMHKPYGYIYLITHIETGRYYVGQTTLAPYKRWNGHVCDGGKRAKCTIDRAIGKYGKAAFAFEVVASALDKKQLDHLEAVWIIALRSRERGIGFNVRHGGIEGGHSEESKSKLRAARARQVITPEMYAKGGMKRRGRLVSEDARRKSSEKQKGRVVSEDTKRRMSEAKKRYLSDPENLARFMDRLPAPGRKYEMSAQGKANISAARLRWHAEHPDAGKEIAIKRAPSTKKYWDSLSPEQKDARISPARAKRWDGVSQEERDKQAAMMRARKTVGV